MNRSLANAEKPISCYETQLTADGLERVAGIFPS
jgi:hypothetical protein